MTLQIPPSFLAFLDWVETTSQWEAADKHWMEWALGASLDEFDMDGPHFAALALSYTSKVKEIVSKYHPDHEDGCPACPLAEELTCLTVHMSVMAAIATRELRNKPPISALPKRPVDPSAT